MKLFTLKEHNHDDTSLPKEREVEIYNLKQIIVNINEHMEALKNKNTKPTIVHNRDLPIYCSLIGQGSA